MPFDIHRDLSSDEEDEQSVSPMQGPVAERGQSAVQTSAAEPGGLSHLMQVATSPSNPGVVNNYYLAIHKVDIDYNGSVTKTVTHPATVQPAGQGQHIAVSASVSDEPSRTVIQPVVKHVEPASPKNETTEFTRADPAIAKQTWHMLPVGPVVRSGSMHQTDQHDADGDNGGPEESDATETGGDFDQGPRAINAEASKLLVPRRDLLSSTPTHEDHAQHIGDLAEATVDIQETPLQALPGADRTTADSQSNSKDTGVRDTADKRPGEPGDRATQPPADAHHARRTRSTGKRYWITLPSIAVLVLAFTKVQTVKPAWTSSIPSPWTQDCAVTWPEPLASCAATLTYQPPSWLTDIEGTADYILRRALVHREVLNAANQANGLQRAETEQLKASINAISTSASALSASSKDLAALISNMQNEMLTVICDTYTSAYTQANCDTSPSTLNDMRSVTLPQAVQNISLIMDQYSNSSTLLFNMANEAFTLQSANTQAWETWKRGNKRMTSNKMAQCLWYSLSIDLAIDCPEDNPSTADAMSMVQRFVNSGTATIKLLIWGREQMVSVRDHVAFLQQDVLKFAGDERVAVIDPAAGAVGSVYRFPWLGVEIHMAGKSDEVVQLFPWFGFETTMTMAEAEWITAMEWVRRLAGAVSMEVGKVERSQNPYLRV